MAEASTPQETAEPQSLIAAMVRQQSEAGELISDSEILTRLANEYPPPGQGPWPAERLMRVLEETIDGNEDLCELEAGDGSRLYYSSRFMTQTYAAILIQKQGDPRRLISECVRQNSAAYPRPISLDIFTQPPFDLTLEQVLDCLTRMASEEEYRDIASTSTSESTLFLYSTLYLEPDHASMLAEWLDVGQLSNP